MPLKNEVTIQTIKDQLSEHFDMKDMGLLHHFLGMRIVQELSTRSIWIGQDRYIQDILRKHGMESCKPAATPMEPGIKLGPSKDTDELADQNHQSAVGSLLFLSVSTRPDIAYAVSSLASYCARPSRDHWGLVKRILRYLRGTQSLGLRYKSSEGDLIAYSDADWAGSREDRKSTSGYVTILSNAAITWKSKKQTVVALSTAEAEYVALSAATQEVCWMRKLLDDLGEQCSKPTVIMEDNQSAIAIAGNPSNHNRTKHIDIKYHYTRQAIRDDIISLTYCPSSDMIADILTKPLHAETFKRLRDRLGLVTLVVD